MGFVVPLGGSSNYNGQGNSASGTAVSVLGMKVGDLLFVAMFTSAASDTFSVTGMTNAFTVLENNVNLGGLAVGGNGTGWIGYTTVTQADLATKSFTINETKGSTIGYCWFLVRPTAGVTCTVQANAAASSFVSATTATCPQNAPLQTHDCRLLFIFGINNPNATLTTVTEAKTASNPQGKDTYFYIAGQGGTSSYDIMVMCNSGYDPSSLDTGTATITANIAQKWYIRPVVVSEGASDSNPNTGNLLDADISPVPIAATEADAPPIVAASPAYGGGVSVF